jgi:hypothetical protein
VESCTALVEDLDGTLQLLAMAPTVSEAIATRVALT